MHERLNEWKKWDHAAMITLHPLRYRDKCIFTYAERKQCTYGTSSSLGSAVSCKLCCLCPLGAGWRYMSLGIMWSLEWCQKKWKVIFLKAPHRVLSHYRACQIKLVTEFAAQERGQVRQDGEGCSMGMEWISWCDGGTGWGGGAMMI